jgi:hypothetical protein
LSSHFRFGHAAGSPGNRRDHHPHEHEIRPSTPVLFLVFPDGPLYLFLVLPGGFELALMQTLVTEFGGSYSRRFYPKIF